MNIFVGGSLRKVPIDPELCGRFVRDLGREIIDRDHTLLTGCRGSLDKAIAEAANERAIERGLDPRQQIISYRQRNAERAHDVGRIQISRLADWELTHATLNPPEQVAEADVTLFVAGLQGTFMAANWARIADRPVLGVARFGGAGAEIFERERDRFQTRYAKLVGAEDFDILCEDTNDCAQLAKDVVSLCERVVTSNQAFTIMPFTEEFRDVFAAYRAVCADFGFDAIRTDQSGSGERIIPRILDGIRHSAFVIADVTHATPNVFYEIGFADGTGAPAIVTARAGTELPFDVADVPVVFWRSLEELKEKLKPRVGDVVARLSRRRR